MMILKGFLSMSFFPTQEKSHPALRTAKNKSIFNEKNKGTYWGGGGGGGRGGITFPFSIFLPVSLAIHLCKFK